MAKTPEAPKMKRRQQFVETFKMARKCDPRLVWWLLGAFVVGAAVGFGLFWFLPGSGTLGLVSRDHRRPHAGPAGRPHRVLPAGPGRGVRPDRGPARRGRLGPDHAAARLEGRPAVAFNKQQDVVHRVVGPPGIVLVGEGNPTRLKALLATERRRHERVAAETPVHEIVVGDGEGQVPLPKLVSTSAR